MNALAEVSFGEWLKRRRRGLGWTQQQFAAQIHCSTVMLKKIEAEERRPSAQIVEQLAEVFNIPPNEQTAFLRFARGDWKSAPTLQSEEAPWRISIPVPRSNLPVPLTSFIGREKQVEEIIQLLNKNRLVTLTGIGGIGKTRLAIHVAKNLTKSYKDGVWWVELAPVIDSQLVPQAIAQVLGVRESPSQPLTESLKSFLAEKQLVLILDNCEHIITAGAQLADNLLARCANLRILTTSRETLGITGEIIYRVPSLSLPKSQRVTLTDLLIEYEGIRLFVERASAVDSDFELTEQNTAAVLQICRRLDGISLALELAAARVKLLSVENIAERLNDRFNLLTDGSRTALPRHQTLQATIDWSYDLLPESEQILFRRLAIFVGGFTLEAAEIVGAADGIKKSQVIDLLGQLVNKSLITVAPHSENVNTRYGMLETIREYARKKLNQSSELERLRQRQRDFFIALAEQTEPKLRGAEQFAWLDRLEDDYDNLRAAWDCAIEDDAKLAFRLVSALLDFWIIRGNRNEGREWLARLLEQTNQWGKTSERAHVLGMAGLLAHFQQDLEMAQRLLVEALDIAQISADKNEIAFALLWLGRTALQQREDRTAQSLIEECLTIYQELQDQRGIAIAMYMLGGLATNQGHYAQAEERAMKSLTIFQELGDKFWVGYVLNGLGEDCRLQDDYARAGRFYERSLENLRELRGRFALAHPLCNLAWASLHQDDIHRAKALFEESLNLHKEDGNWNAITIILAGFAGILGMSGKPEQAAQLFGAVEASLEAIGMHGRMLQLSDQKEFNHYAVVVRGQLDKAVFEKAWAEGRAMTMEQAIEFALKETQV